ncbi:monovalent cation/H+ antiporter complex subunit F [Aeromicrobium chenweiae]|uniref:Cation:proton antiporter n=1 Tax=Aeromicrobium chenweiae TaxID=2079793 RepID=A0A2S0WQA2_9ACTN|nr:monovalent cation/H+ antiporter complex subunit F [Aeromicrobium chenweiae]AWB93482.1 cation:proton antiporter [Aeromicrobium chenweiae]TGN34475.1 cation:proton antiporter [Aeromicrobium chenweiae]
MTITLLVAAAMLFVGAVCALARMTMGPTVLDRAVALDVFVALGICGLAIQAAHSRHTFTLPLLLVLTLLGFVGSVSVARFTQGSDDIEEDQA